MTKENNLLKFSEMNYHAATGNKEGYYMESYELMQRGVIRYLVSKVYIIEDYEDLKQQISVEYYELLQQLDTISITESITEYKEVAYLNDKHEIIKKQEPLTKKVKTAVSWTEAPPQFLWHTLKMDTIDRLYRYFNGKSINAGISIDYTIADYGSQDFSDKEVSLVNTLEHVGAALELDRVGTIEAIRGNLSQAEYRFLIGWYIEGKKLYDSTKITNKVRAKLKALDITPVKLSAALNGEIGAAAKRAAALDTVELIDRVTDKLYKLTR